MFVVNASLEYPVPDTLISMSGKKRRIQRKPSDQQTIDISIFHPATILPFISNQTMLISGLLFNRLVVWCVSGLMVFFFHHRKEKTKRQIKTHRVIRGCVSNQYRRESAILFIRSICIIDYAFA